MNRFDELGDEGWELVTCYLENETAFPNLGARSDLVTGIRVNIRPQRLVCLFKRQKIVKKKNY
jgi:hypothetical protein